MARSWTTFFAAAVLVAFSVPLAAQREINANVFRSIGMKTTSSGDTNYHSLDFDIGLQRRQDGETGSYEKWTMHFNSELNSYSLNIVRLDSEIRSWEYSTTDGSIVWENADWETGIYLGLLET